MTRAIALFLLMLWLSTPRHPLEKYDRPSDQWGELDGLTRDR